LVESTNRWEVDIRTGFKKHNFSYGFLTGVKLVCHTKGETKDGDVRE